MQQKGFTLLEILLVIAGIVVLASIVIIAINPAKQLATVRNSQRSVDINTIYKAAYQYDIEHTSLPSTITDAPKEICRTGASDCTGMVDLSDLTNNGIYLVSLPTDPKSSSANGTGYIICKTIYGRPVVYSSLVELDQNISTGGLCLGSTRNTQRSNDIKTIEEAINDMHDENGYYFIDPLSSTNSFMYRGNYLVGGSTRAGNCSTVTSESGSSGSYGSGTPCPIQSNWCIKLGADLGTQDQSAGANCDSGTVYLRNIPLNNYLPAGTWTTGWHPYVIFVQNNFDGNGNDYFRIQYRLEGSATHDHQSDHFMNGVAANCHYDGSSISTNNIVCQ